MSIFCPIDTSPKDHTSVIYRIKKKKNDYERYNFSTIQDWTLRAFFDLAQEYLTIENFYRVCVFVPKEFLGFDSCLYLVDLDTKELKKTCDSLSGLKFCGYPPPENIHLNEASSETSDSLLIPIKGNLKLFPEKPLSQPEEVIGMFEIFPLSQLSDSDRFFFEKYANRIGYNLHYKVIALQNERHLKFINDLIADIEHNVITPNILFKVFLKRLSKNIKNLSDLKQQLENIVFKALPDSAPRENSLDNFNANFSASVNSLKSVYVDLERHYENTSLFLETLLRRDHFVKGELVLRKRWCNFKKEVIDPQILRYEKRLERKGIRIDNLLGGVPYEDFPLSVDVGLISQVYANFFSNVEKYASDVYNDYGQNVKFMAYGREIIPDFFGYDRPGIKFNVFSTGPHIPPEEAKHLFNEGYRLECDTKKPGSGHGLYFVKRIIRVHGGVVGYEPKPLGNNFYFILPLQKDLEKEEKA